MDHLHLPMVSRPASRAHAAILATLFLATASFLLVGGSQHLLASSNTRIRGDGHIRIEVGLRQGPSEKCETDCVVFVPRAISVPTPQNDESVDLTLTVGLKYKTSAARDHAYIQVELSPNAGDSSLLRPGAMRLSSTTATSTTLTWIGRSLPGNGRTYSFLLTARLQHGVPPSFVSTRNVVVVADVWPAGPH
jgi:hypothetical protein